MTGLTKNLCGGAYGRPHRTKIIYQLLLEGTIMIIIAIVVIGLALLEHYYSVTRHEVK